MEHIRERIKEIEARLEAAGVETPQSDAQWLIAAATETPAGHWRFWGPPTPEALERLEAWVQRRCQREPLQYILGTAPFGDLMLEVDPRVLIPRPETECLLEQIPQHWPCSPQRFLDLGTGSGALALGLAQLFPKAQGVAADLEPRALELAQKNVEALGFGERIRCIQSDWFSDITGRFDLIVANPPYLTQEEWAQATPEVRDHEPLSALVAQEQGLADLKILLTQAPSFLTPGGCLVMETGLGHPAQLTALARKMPYSRTVCSQDLLQRERFFWAFMPERDSA